MYPFRSVSVGSLVCLFITWPALMSGTHKQVNENSSIAIAAPSIPDTTTVIQSTEAYLREEALTLYNTIQLKKLGLSEKAFEYAWKGYYQLRKKGKVKKDDVLSICDFSQSSRRKRLYIIDLTHKKVLVNTYVAHGRRSGGEYARYFSNKPESHQSSLGFYITRRSYYGGHGLALKIEGLENGINDKADERHIVIHGSEYVSADYIRNHRYSGRSLGCPAVPKKDSEKIIQNIKGGSCLFIYHPTTRYLLQSKLLNGL